MVFGKLFMKWADNKQSQEARDFLARIKTPDSEELGLFVAMTLNTAKTLGNGYNVDFFQPAQCLALHPNLTFNLSGMAGELQKQGDLNAAGPVIVWVHSLRAMVSHEVRPIAREIWGNLARGFPYAVDAAEQYYEFCGVKLDVTRLGEFPQGLNPVRE